MTRFECDIAIKTYDSPFFSACLYSVVVLITSWDIS